MKNTRKILAVVLAIFMIVSTMPVAYAADTQENIVILYTNDVHCSIDDYAKLAAYKAELIAEGNTVITVDAGDAIQSDTICSMTVGEAIVDIMNAVGYDYAVPGNHEYDYGVEVFLDLAETKAEYKYISSNFHYLPSASSVFAPYYIEDVGNYQIAFVGISTPETITPDSSERFKDENNNFIYGFPRYPGGMTNEILYENIQESVDDAKANGADVVIAVGHTGITETTDGWKTSDIIANTSGIDYFIDAHSHETVEEEFYKNMNDEDVVRTSTGSEFANFGAITIHSDGYVDFELINPDAVNVDAMSADAKTAYNTVKEKIDYYNVEFEAISHNYETVVTPPNCTEDGYTTYTCPVCGDTYTSDETGALGHDYDDGVVTPPTCTEYGYTTYTCTACEEWYTDDDTDPLGHQIGDDGLCEECGEECTHIDEDVDEKCDDCDAILDYEEVEFNEINTVHIPEADKAVVVKFTPTESGWYAVVSDNGGDDDNIDPYVAVLDADGEEIAYDDDSDYEDDTYNFYCEFEVKAGETYYIALYSYDEDVEYDYEIKKHIGIDHQPTSAEPYVTLTWDLEAKYQWFNLDDEMIAIDGETEATLKNPKIGSIYGCVVTYNGIEMYSDVLYYDYAITHQPTADEPYVELNDDTDATYQWYRAEEGIVELTDENTIAFPGEDEGPIYDAEKGWSGVYVGSLEGVYDCYAYFIVSLKAGDTISIELFGDYYGYVEFIDMMSGGFYIGEIDEDGKCEFTVEEDGYYAVATYRNIDGDEVFVKAYMNGYEFTKIDGATNAEYTPTEDGLYACEVTFADDSTEMSKVFEKVTTPADDDDNTGNNTGGNAGNNNENTKPAPSPEIPNTDANSNVCFAMLLVSAFGLVTIAVSNKKKVFTK